MIATTKVAEYCITERMSFALYNELKALRASSLKHMLVSPLKYQHEGLKSRVGTDSDTLRVGRAVHTAILEPERFLREYAEWQNIDDATGKKRIRSGGRWEEFQEVNAGKTILTSAQFSMAIGMRDLVRDHKIAGPLVKASGRSELSLQWTHKRTGAPCKARLDRLTNDGRLFDIKTTRDVEKEAFQRQAFQLKYFFQLAFYRMGCIACGLGDPRVKIVCVQNTEPYDVVVRDIRPEVLDRAMVDVERAIDMVLACRKAQAWPGQGEEGEIDLDYPAWALLCDEEETIDFGTEVIQ